MSSGSAMVSQSRSSQANSFVNSKPEKAAAPVDLKCSRKLCSSSVAVKVVSLSTDLKVWMSREV
jgi:hypothetical protein